MNMFSGSDCTVHGRDLRALKSEPRDCSALSSVPSSKLVHPSDSMLYHGTANLQDNRMVWAALTPRGTQHFISDNYPRDLVDYHDSESHYETIDYIQPVLSSSAYNTYSSYHKGLFRFNKKKSVII